MNTMIYIVNDYHPHVHKNQTKKKNEKKKWNGRETKKRNEQNVFINVEEMFM